MLRRVGILMALFFLAFFSDRQALAGRLYEWLDGDGTRHYSDRAPQTLPYQEVDVRPASGDGGTDIEPGIRAGERRMLENARRRDARIEQDRFASARGLEKRRERCRVVRDRYLEALHQPRSARGSDFKMLRKTVNQACD